MREIRVGFPRGPFAVSRRFVFWRWFAVVLLVPSSLGILVGYVSLALQPGDVVDFAGTQSDWMELVVFVSGVGLAMAVGYMAWLPLRQLRRVRTAAQKGVLRLAMLIHRERIRAEGQDTGAEKVVFRLRRADGTFVDVTWQLGTKGGLLTAHGGRSVLALVPTHDPTLAVLVLSSLYPLALGAADAQQLRAALAVAPELVE